MPPDNCSTHGHHTKNTYLLYLKPICSKREQAAKPNKGTQLTFQKSIHCRIRKIACLLELPKKTLSAKLRENHSNKSPPQTQQIQRVFP